ncbi:MAG: tetratricopeptide repeat protein [Methanomicrobiales archaeon]|nr:tetratricopeptide repeat protein [Methanomicrobiales archaeon]
MQWKRIALGMMVILCMFTVYQAGALDTAAGQGRNTGDGRPGHGQGITAILDRLETQGYDVSAIRAAMDSGDLETARTLLDRFREEHPYAFPGPAGSPAVGVPVDADRISGILERLKEEGLDISEIQSALDNESLDTAMKLLRKFMEEHREELGMPDRVPPGDGDEANHMTLLLEKLEEQGYEVAAIRAAVETGDTDTARTLLGQFREEHPDAFPGTAGRHGGGGPMNADRITVLLEKLAEKGYDVTAIQAVIDGGDLESARTLLRQFMEEHRDELPKPGRTTETTD